MRLGYDNVYMQAVSVESRSCTLRPRPPSRPSVGFVDRACSSPTPEPTAKHPGGAAPMADAARAKELWQELRSVESELFSLTQNGLLEFPPTPRFNKIKGV
jgi:hypothetical protein